MYVYIQSESGLWTVGFYSPDGKWNPESDHSSKEEAANRIHWLNGGEIEPVVIQQKDSGRSPTWNSRFCMTPGR